MSGRVGPSGVERWERHNWKSTTFHKPTYCDGCTMFIWGVFKQGYECGNCHKKVHKDCRAHSKIKICEVVRKRMPEQAVLTHRALSAGDGTGSTRLEGSSTDDFDVDEVLSSSEAEHQSVDMPYNAVEDAAERARKKSMHCQGYTFYEVFADCVCEGMSGPLNVEKGTIIYRSCDGSIVDGHFEGAVCSGPHVGRVGVFSVDDMSPTTEDAVRNLPPPPIKKDIRLRLRSVDESHFRTSFNTKGLWCRPYGATFWHLLPPRGYCTFSDVVEQAKSRAFTNSTTPQDSTLRQVFFVSEHESGNLIAKPVGFELLWTSFDFNGPLGAGEISKAFSIWRPIPPVGYVSMGYLFTNSTAIPGRNNIVCVHRDACVQGIIPRDSAKKGMLWSSRGTSFEPPLVCWPIEPASGASQLDFSAALSVGGFFASTSLKEVDVTEFSKIFLLRKERISVTEMKQKRQRALSSIDPNLEMNQYLGLIVSQTCFDMDEMLLLYGRFKQASTSKKLDCALSQEEFAVFFSGHTFDKELLSHIFQAIDVDQSGTLDFAEFAYALSTMTRGSVEEKVDYAFQICDLDGSGFVERAEVRKLSAHLQRLAYSATDGEAESKYQSADAAVDNIFTRRGTSNLRMSIEGVEGGGEEHYLNMDVRTAAEEEDEEADVSSSVCDVSASFAAAASGKAFEPALSYQEFCARAKMDVSFVNCFGLFDFFYDNVIVPIEVKIYGDSLNQKEIAGILHKEKGESVWNQTIQLFSAYDKRWFVCRGGHFAYFRDEKSKVPLNILNLTNVVLRSDRNNENWFRLETPDFARALCTSSKKQRQVWMNAIRNNIPQMKNRYGSFAPIRQEQRCEWFVNGKEYFDHLLEVLPRAKHRVFISDWSFSPQLYLRRDSPLDERTRVDKLIQATAERGVKVYILIWYASTIGFDIKAKWSVQYMMSLCPENIKAVAHPPWTPVIWSHHQKFVVIDDQVAYVGGVDLCFNRYDDSKYDVADLKNKKFPYRDYNNLNFPGCGETNGLWDREAAGIERSRAPRMPWHDIHMVVEGQAAMDVSYNFIQRWNHAVKGTGSDISWYILPESAQEVRDRPNILREKEVRAESVECQVLRSVGFWSAGQTAPEQSIYRAYESLIQHARHFIYIENQYFISSVTRTFPQNRIAKALYERLRYAIANKQRFRVIVILPVFPAGDIFSAATKYVIKYVYKTINRDSRKRSLLSKLQDDFPDADLSDYITFHGLRNYGYVEEPITADTIPEQELAKSSSMSNDDDTTEGHLMRAESDLNRPEHSMRYSMTGSMSVATPTAAALEECWEMVDAKMTRPKLVTEQVYVHAKLMIIDDRYIICGSANINDRSMMGDRDSELCIVTNEPSHKCETVIWDGMSVKVSPLAHSLRKRLFRDYLGLSEEEDNLVVDPLSDSTYKLLWKEQSRRNTEIYSAIFPFIPNNVSSVDMLFKCGEYPGCVVNHSEKHRIKDLKGFVTDFPMNFLELDHLSPPVGSAEYMVPRVTFV